MHRQRGRQPAQYVRIAGGGATILEYVNAGLIDEFSIALSQPFTEAVVEVGLKDARGDASIRWFKISALPPGTSWFAFDSNGKSPKTLLLSIWSLDNGVRT